MKTLESRAAELKVLLSLSCIPRQEPFFPGQPSNCRVREFRHVRLKVRYVLTKYTIPSHRTTW